MASPHWSVASRAAERSGVAILPLAELRDCDRVAVLIREIWGEEQGIPRELVRALQHAGTVLLGAEADGQLVGFVLGFMGFGGGLHLHSHMLAVLPDWQSRGVGYSLKLAQRAACLDEGVDEIRWTYDPLMFRNARLNLVKLGALAVRFLPAFYGEMRDRLNRGDRSDRFEVTWHLRSHRVLGALERAAVHDAEALTDPSREGRVLVAAEGAPDAPRPLETPWEPQGGATGVKRRALVSIPSDHHALRSKDQRLALEWRDASARAFRACFESGLAATWITRDATYIFEVPDEGR